MKPLSALLAGKERARKKKIKLIRTTALLFFCVSIILISALHGSTALGENREPQTIYVSQGDTLWSIARRHAPGGADTRDYLGQIFLVNQLSSPIIHQGQRLVLP